MKDVILHSVDCLFLTNDNKVLFIKREKDPQKNKLALVGGVQNQFESFEDAIIRILKLKLGVTTKIENKKIIINKHEFSIEQFKTFDSGKDPRGGNTTLFVIETNYNETKLKEIISKEVYFHDINKLPNLAFEHNKFISDYFFNKKNYAIGNVQDIGITIDIVILTVQNNLLKVLLAKRSKEPFKDYYTLPGGFIENNLNLEENAFKILKRDTNITNAYLEQLYTFSEIERDPRGRVITVSYYALIDYSKINLIHSLHVDEINWFSESDLKKL